MRRRSSSFELGRTLPMLLRGVFGGNSTNQCGCFRSSSSRSSVRGKGVEIRTQRRIGNGPISRSDYARHYFALALYALQVNNRTLKFLKKRIKGVTAAMNRCGKSASSNMVICEQEQEQLRVGLRGGEQSTVGGGGNRGCAVTTVETTALQTISTSIVLRRTVTIIIVIPRSQAPARGIQAFARVPPRSGKWAEMARLRTPHEAWNTFIQLA
ncbi:hypothetical protein BD410DRAFT_800561 [Rickenella mellea]|uniref:Uncharacterized protein n=1 Tax=Rickenella mellea TaxID=50990 RepID=A0A4Y7QET5_9AGAM|nr:hypothetical protein BD410DRAFT_800561 [Rickenella mellea]